MRLLGLVNHGWRRLRTLESAAKWALLFARNLARNATAFCAIVKSNPKAVTSSSDDDPMQPGKVPFIKDYTLTGFRHPSSNRLRAQTFLMASESVTIPKFLHPAALSNSISLAQFSSVQTGGIG